MLHRIIIQRDVHHSEFRAISINLCIRLLPVHFFHSECPDSEGVSLGVHPSNIEAAPG
jgi:hypothetical protein